MAICVITHNQAREWTKTGNRPCCQFHHHVSFAIALKEVMAEEAYALPGQRAIVRYTSVTDYSWTGASSEGYQVMQMRRVGR